MNNFFVSMATFTVMSFQTTSQKLTENGRVDVYKSKQEKSQKFIFSKKSKSPLFIPVSASAMTLALMLGMGLGSIFKPYCSVILSE